MIMEPVKLEKYLSYVALNRLNPGNQMELISGTNFIMDKKQATLSWEAEGELFLPFHPSKFQVLDFSSPTGERICILVFGEEQFQSFRVTPVDQKSLSLEELRVAAPIPKTFPCKQCSKTITLLSFPLAQSCACTNCGATHIFQNGIDFKKTGIALPASGTDLALGAEGIINGVSYKVVGYAEKEEKNIHHSRWREYTLYNEQEGFAFLSEYDGHWIFLREAVESPVILNANEKKIVYENRNYSLFNSYTYEVVSASGEFPYNLFDNEKTNCKEYISPPVNLIQERDKVEGIRWFRGDHPSGRKLQTAFRSEIVGVREPLVQGRTSLGREIEKCFPGCGIELPSRSGRCSARGR